MQISDNLKILMNARGWNQKDLAEKAETTQASISRTLSGSIPSSEIIYNLKKNVNVDPLWLLTGEGEMFLSRKEVARDARTEDAFEVARRVVQNPKMRKFVERILDLDKKNFEKLQAYLDGMEGK